MDERICDSKGVVVVDDDPDIRETVSMVLENEGYRVASARNGREALDLLRSFPQPGLILLDLMMPAMDGWAFRAEQKRDPQLTSIPVVVLSAFASRELRKGELDVSDYLGKPVQLEALLAMVEKYCPLRASSAVV